VALHACGLATRRLATGGRTAARSCSAPCFDGAERVRKVGRATSARPHARRCRDPHAVPKGCRARFISRGKGSRSSPAALPRCVAVQPLGNARAAAAASAARSARARLAHVSSNAASQRPHHAPRRLHLHALTQPRSSARQARRRALALRRVPRPYRPRASSRCASPGRRASRRAEQAHDANGRPQISSGVARELRG